MPTALFPSQVHSLHLNLFNPAFIGRFFSARLAAATALREGHPTPHPAGVGGEWCVITKELESIAGSGLLLSLLTLLRNIVLMSVSVPIFVHNDLHQAYKAHNLMCLHVCMTAGPPALTATTTGTAAAATPSSARAAATGHAGTTRSLAHHHHAVVAASRHEHWAQHGSLGRACVPGVEDAE